MAEKTTADIGFEKQIWDAACVLRGNMDASEYKNVVLGLIFLKYISDRFEEKHRELIAEGEIEQANRLLGHPHSLADTVHSGYHLGTKMGTPTINMFFPEGVLVPKHGVYATRVYLEGGANYVAVTNVGVRPTVSSSGRVSVESFLLDYSGNLYGRQARVDFYSFIRPERRFDDFEELSAQIKHDAETAREYFITHKC